MGNKKGSMHLQYGLQFGSTYPSCTLTGGDKNKKIWYERDKLLNYKTLKPLGLYLLYPIINCYFSIKCNMVNQDIEK